MVAAVHVVAHEQVVGVGGGAADAEQLQQVLELAVDVAAHLQWIMMRGSNAKVSEVLAVENTVASCASRSWNWAWMSPHTYNGQLGLVRNLNA